MKTKSWKTENDQCHHRLFQSSNSSNNRLIIIMKDGWKMVSRKPPQWLSRSLSLSLSTSFFLISFYHEEIEKFRQRLNGSTWLWVAIDRPDLSALPASYIFKKLLSCLDCDPPPRRIDDFEFFFFLYFFFNLVINKHLISCGTFHSSWSVTYFDCLQQQQKIV